MSFAAFEFSFALQLRKLLLYHALVLFYKRYNLFLYEQFSSLKFGGKYKNILRAFKAGFDEILRNIQAQVSIGIKS